MKRNQKAIVLGAMVSIAAASCLIGCGFKRQLVSISVIPDNESILGPGLEVQFKAFGNYIHPPDTRDITDSVVWQSALPQAVSISATGLATSGTACGRNVAITATAHSDPHDSSSGLVLGTAVVTVTQPPPGPTC